MARRVLHVLSQRPSLTGSGVTLDAVVRHAAVAGWEQQVIVGTPADDPTPAVGDLPTDRVDALTFAGEGGSARGDLTFPLPGMSDVMPYRSTRFSQLTSDQLTHYRAAWQQKVQTVVARFAPDVIHAHHAWLLSSWLQGCTAGVPVVTHTHGTALRQRQLSPALATEVEAGFGAHSRLVVLHEEHARQYSSWLGLESSQVRVVGAGYADETFSCQGRSADAVPTVVYAGKLSHAKGLPWLLDAIEALGKKSSALVFHVAGGGEGAESDELRARMAALAPLVEYHGRLAPADLAALLRRAWLFVLPSFYEGLPLVLVEALASGCRVVSTELPGVVSGLQPHVEHDLELVELPRLYSVDQPVDADLPAFVVRLAAAVERGLESGPLVRPGIHLDPFTWRAVFERIAAVWAEAIA